MRAPDYSGLIDAARALLAARGNERPSRLAMEGAMLEAEALLCGIHRVF